MTSTEPRSQFLTGIERAAHHWLAYWQDHAGDADALHAACGHALRALTWCIASGKSLNPAIDLAVAMHEHMWFREEWHEWEASLRYLLIKANTTATPERLFVLRRDLSALYFRQGRLEESITLALENYRWAVETGDRGWWAAAAIVLAEAYLNAEQPAQALTYAEESTALAMALDAPVRQADGLINAARALTDMGELAQAERRLRRAYSLALAAESAKYQAKAQLFLGHVLGRAGRWQEALDHYQTALALVTSYDDEVGRGVVQNGLGQALMELGRLEEACRLLADALRIHRRHGNLPAERTALQRLQALQARQVENRAGSVAARRPA